MAINVEIAGLLNIATGECENIQENLHTVVSKLLNSYDDILTCVQSTELNKTITVLKADVESVCNRLLTALPGTTEFLKNQMSSYSEANKVARDAVNQLISRINSLTTSVPE